jgi:DNA polymerase I-like protein with 3'-5' exonuclease and polymerase domains
MKPFSIYPYVAIDVETYGLNWWDKNHGIFGIAISYPDGSDYYFDIRRQPEGLEWLRKQRPLKIINHNMKFDLHMLWSAGVKYDPAICECTMVRASLIFEHEKSYSLDNLAKKYLNSQKIDDIYDKLAEIFDGPPTRQYQIKNLHKAPPELVAKYAKTDTRLALQLYEWQEKQIQQQGLQKITAFEQRLFPAIFDMERRGVRVNTKQAEQSVDILTKEIDISQQKLNDIAGFACNPNPSLDMHKLFKPQQNNDGMWLACDGTILPKTPAGKPSLNSEALRNMKHPAADVILKIRKYLRCRDTFLKGHILSNVHNDYLHPNINQVKGDAGGTGSGRLSITRPALQQIPARDKEIASIMRPLFLPDADSVWGCWDYEQFEFRMFSHYVNDPKIIKLYHDNPKIDYHQMVADLTGLPRNAPMSGGANAKQLNLAMIYDMGEASIANMLNLPLDPNPYTFKNKEGVEHIYYKAGEEAKAIIEKYHTAIPGVRELYSKCKTVGKSRQYLKSIMGRHMRYPNGYGLNKAKAVLCQGSSADCMKQKIIELYDYFTHDEPDCRMYISVHDEINLGIPKDHPKMLKIIRNVKNILEDFDKDSKIPLRIPIKTDFGIGYNWAQASGKG